MKKTSEWLDIAIGTLTAVVAMIVITLGAVDVFAHDSPGCTKDGCAPTIVQGNCGGKCKGAECSCQYMTDHADCACRK